MSDESTNIKSDIIAFHDKELSDAKKKWEIAKENVGLMYNDHFTETAKTQYKMGERVPLNMPLIFPCIQSLLGFEKSNRNAIIVEPHGAEDELNSEIANHLMKWVFKNNQWEHLRDELFEDGIVPTYGVVRIFAEQDDYGFDKIKIERIPYNRLLWDNNFTNYDMTDCSRMQHFEWVYLDDLIVMFPDKEQFIRDNLAGDRNFDDSDTAPLKNLTDYYTVSLDYKGNKREDKYLIKLIHDYKKVNKTIYELHDIKTGDIEEFEDKKTAEEEKAKILGEVSIGLLQQAMLLQVMPPAINPDDFFIIKPVPKKRIQYSCATFNHLFIEPVITDDEEFEFITYFSMFKDGVWWTLVDILKDTQREWDKLWTQIDYSIATDVKTVFGMDETKLSPTNGPAEARIIMTRGGIVFTQGDPRLLAHPLESKGADPTYFTVMEGLKFQTQDATGGKQFQGLPDPSNTTKGGIEMLQTAATMQASNYLKNLEKTDLQVGKRVIKLIQKHYNYADTVKILGSELTERIKQALTDNGYYAESTMNPETGWLKVNPEGKTPIGDSSFIVSVQSKDARMNSNEYKLSQLFKYAQTTGKPIPPKTIGRLLGFTATETAELEAEDIKQQQMMMEAQAEQDRLNEIGQLSTVIDKTKQDNGSSNKNKAGKNGVPA